MTLAPRRRLLASLLLATVGGGCAAVAPAQLLGAREAYSRSSQGPAGRWMTIELADGKKMLDRADAEFDQHGDTPAVRDYAYIATRKFSLADVRAQNELDRQSAVDSTIQGSAARDELARRSEEALARTRAQLQRERSANDAAASVLQAARATPAEGPESADRREVDRRGQALQDAQLERSWRELGPGAAVHQDGRGLVITLDGAALFVTGQATLLPGARGRLERVAGSLRALGPDRQVSVEGHTDGVGSEAFNLPLSERHAAAVRDELVRLGVPPQQVTAVGLGSSRPLRDDGSPGSRARNRRVEIVVRAAPVTSLERRPTPSSEP